LSTRLFGILKEKVEENVPSTIARKLVPLPTPTPSSTSTTEVSLGNSDQIPDDCEPLPDGLGPRLNAQTLKTLVKTQLG